MGKIKNIVWIIAIIGVAFLYAHVDKSYYLYDRSQDSSTYIATGVVENGVLSQTFVSEVENIDGIELKATVYGEIDRVNILYKLIDGETKELLEQGEIPGTDLKNSKFYNLKFNRVEKAKGKEYVFQIEEQGADKNNGIGFSIGNPKSEDIGKEVIVNQNQIQGVMICRLIEHGFDIETFIVFLAFVAYIVGFMKILYKLFK